MLQSPNHWMPREKWESLVRGENCPLCAAIRATDPADAYAFTVADFPSGRLKLARNQFIPGYYTHHRGLFHE